MRHVATSAVLILLTLTLGACGDESSKNDSGPGVSPDGIPDGFPDGIPDLVPSSDVPALLDTAGMTEAQLEAKVEEIDTLIDEVMAEMETLSEGATPGGMNSAKAQRLVQVTADMRALAAQVQAYEAALDALDH
jgi:hypothetical protein